MTDMTTDITTDINTAALLKVSPDAEKFKQLLKSAESFRELMTYYRCAIFEVETKFNVLSEEFSLKNDRNPIETIKTRLKTPQSIVEKMAKKGIPLRFSEIEDNISDIAGIRVICPFQDDIYMLAECFLSQDDITLVEKKDYIKNPKPNGYRSLHLIVTTPIFLTSGKKMMRAEIQLRTIAMDFWASLEHSLRYKKNLPDSLKLSDDLLKCAEDSADLDLRMMSIRRQIDAMKEGSE